MTTPAKAASATGKGDVAALREALERIYTHIAGGSDQCLLPLGDMHNPCWCRQARVALGAVRTSAPDARAGGVAGGLSPAVSGSGLDWEARVEAGARALAERMGHEWDRIERDGRRRLVAQASVVLCAAGFRVGQDDLDQSVPGSIKQSKAMGQEPEEER